MTIKNDLYLIAHLLDFTDYTDIIKTKTNFTMLLDSLCKDGQISDKTYNNAYLHIDKQHKTTYLICGSYKLKTEV